MPRQSRARSAPRPAAPPPQARGASTAALPAAGPFSAASPARAPAPPAAVQSQGSQPGLLGQMASTAGGVAAGSVIGHGISSMLFGGSRPAEAPAAAPQVQAQQQGYAVSCEVQAKDFTKCLEKADLNSCGYYLEQLKACQAAAAPY